MTTYVDTSLVLAILMRQRPVDPEIERQGEIVTSELTEIESRRTIDRVRITEGLSDAELAVRLSELDLILRRMAIIELSPAVRKRAKGPFPTVVRTLDALHLATAVLLRESATDPAAGPGRFVTLDAQQRSAALALGFAV